MIVPEEKTDLCQVSLTGMRGLTMLGLLVQAPRSLEEIREKFLELKLIDPHNSNDIIRIDMNTLRYMGCEISRSINMPGGKKYVLNKHPYGLTITEEEVAILKRAYKNIKEGASIEVLLKYDALFRRLAEFVFDDNIKEQLYGISILKHSKISKLKEFTEDCEKRNTLTIEYRDVETSKSKIKKVLAQKVEMRNNKIYLMGYDIEREEPVMLPINRISNVISREINPDKRFEQKPVEVKFFLKNFNAAGIEENEEIIESNDDISQIVRGKYHNEFIAVQRMLSFGPSCIVLEPQEIKQKVVNKLLAMKEVYKNG